MAKKRESISTRTRFEVFKRDQFKCTYCGVSAPNVVLHIDHIKPVSKGGTNALTNLITACASCNGGKSNIELSDTTAISKQTLQAQELQERREQLEMMAKWIDGLQNLDEDAISILEKNWFKDTDNLSWSKYGRDEIRKLLKKFSLLEISQAMELSRQQYLKDPKDTEQRSTAFHKIGAILYISKKTAEDPLLKDAYYCRAIIKNRLVLNKADWELLNMIKVMLKYFDAEYVKDFCKSVKSWSQFRWEYEEALELQNKESKERPENYEPF